DNALPVSYTLPPLRCVRDFHPLARYAAKRTKEELLQQLLVNKKNIAGAITYIILLIST
ncbi:hypothetical protein J2S19_004623, partial [Metabacillus malikii]|nr:hypothetical protein [Metabacillus malikii]